MAVPAYRGWQTKTQPDGTTTTVRLVGDEFYHYWETEDGKIAIEQADGTFVVSTENRPSGEQISQRRMASRMYQSRPRRAIGERNLAPKGLVILVQFANVSFNSSNDATAFDDMLNQVGYNYNGATGSAVDYFKAQSNNTYAPQFDVFGPVTLPQNRVYYGEQGTVNGKTENDLYIADFVIDAVKAADAAGCDFSKYDSDNDNKVDIVYFFYAGKGQAAGGASETIWPHNWTLASALYYGRTHGSSGYSYSNLPKFDGKKIDNYVCSAELRSDGGRSGIGTLCHEFSHVLGMPDYYDTEYGTNSDNGVTPDSWSIMDMGSYNNNEMTPPNYSLFDKCFMGWITSPKFLAKDAKANITMTTAYDDGYQITGGTSGPVAYTNTNTVYYIENRQKVGWDAYLPGSGMIVWQVKYNSSAWSSNEPNNTAGNPRYTIIPADGKTSNYGYSSDAFPTSNVKSYTPLTGCALTEITETSGTITFKYNGGVNKTKCTYEFVAENCTTPDDGEVAINAALSVTITPDEGYSLADASCWDVEMGGVTLTYGTDFTYTPSTNTFYIASLTDDVVIMAEGKQIHTVTWSANGTADRENFIDGTALVLPTPPAECPSGNVFVGWTASTSVNGDKPSDLFTSAGSKTVTSDVTYYAVYAIASSGGGGAPVTVVERMSGSSPYVAQTGWTASAGGTYTSAGNYGNSSPSIKFSSDGNYVQSATMSGAITAVSYWYKPQNASGSLKFYVSTDGTNFSELTAESVSFSSSSTAGTKSITLNPSNGYHAIKIVYSKTTSNVAVDDISVTYGSGVSYSDYSTTCAEVVKHTITWVACGETFKTEQVRDGAALVLPSPAPATNTAGKAFYGWIADENYTGTDAPATISAGTAVTADATYYAVYY